MPLEPIPSAPNYEMDQACKRLDCAASCCRRAANLMMHDMADQAARPIEEAVTLLLLTIGNVTKYQLDAMLARVAEMQAMLAQARKERGA